MDPSFIQFLRENWGRVARCSTCDSASLLSTCAGCHDMAYCGVKCQERDWSKHQLICGKTFRGDEEEEDPNKSDLKKRKEDAPFLGIDDVLTLVMRFLEGEDLKNVAMVDQKLTVAYRRLVFANKRVSINSDGDYNDFLPFAAWIQNIMFRYLPMAFNWPGAYTVKKLFVDIPDVDTDIYRLMMTDELKEKYTNLEEFEIISGDMLIYPFVTNEHDEVMQHPHRPIFWTFPENLPPTLKALRIPGRWLLPKVLDFRKLRFLEELQLNPWRMHQNQAQQSTVSIFNTPVLKNLEISGHSSLDEKVNLEALTLNRCESINFMLYPLKELFLEGVHNVDRFPPTLQTLYIGKTLEHVMIESPLPSGLQRLHIEARMHNIILSNVSLPPSLKTIRLVTETLDYHPDEFNFPQLEFLDIHVEVGMEACQVNIPMFGRLAALASRYLRIACLELQEPWLDESVRFKAESVFIELMNEMEVNTILERCTETTKIVNLLNSFTQPAARTLNIRHLPPRMTEFFANDERINLVVNCDIPETVERLSFKCMGCAIRENRKPFPNLESITFISSRDVLVLALEAPIELLTSAKHVQANDVFYRVNPTEYFAKCNSQLEYFAAKTMAVQSQGFFDAQKTVYLYQVPSRKLREFYLSHYKISFSNWYAGPNLTRLYLSCGYIDEFGNEIKQLPPGLQVFTLLTNLNCSLDLSKCTYPPALTELTISSTVMVKWFREAPAERPKPLTLLFVNGSRDWDKINAM